MTASKSGLSRHGTAKRLFLFILFFIASGATSCSYALNTNLPATLEKQVTMEWIYTPSATPTLTPTPTTTPTPTPLPTPLGSGSGRLAFAVPSDRYDNIFLENIDGTGRIQLTTTGLDWNPAWSPDGRKIIFISERDSFDPHNPNKIVNGEIYIMDADGSNQTRLSNCPAFCWQVAWSPDGKHIVYISDPSGHWEIYVMNSDGSGQTRLTFSGWGASDPTWSPDGAQIAYSASLSGFVGSQIFVMTADGSKRTQLTNNPGWNIFPSWSPDGTRIAFSYINKDWREPDIWDIFMMNADGSGQIKLTDTSKTYPREGCQAPAWSPDGTYISSICGYTSSQWGSIHIINVASQSNLDTNITTENNSGAVWQP